MAVSLSDIEDFLNGPLVAWLSTCVKNPDRLKLYETYFDGWPFNEVLLQIDPEPLQPLPSINSLNEGSLVNARTKVFLSIFKSIKQLYEEELQQIVIAAPDCIIIGKEPNSLAANKQLKLLLLLLLGCAVQGPTKEKFIARIKELPLDLQHDIVECIKQVTESQTLVLTSDWTDQSPEHLYTHVKTLVRERDAILNKWIAELNREQSLKVSSGSEGIENHHLAVELADMKAKLRKQRQEIEEKSELLAEYKEEIEHVNVSLSKLRTENNELLAEVRKAKVFRDEADAMREKAEKADRLEIEMQRYKERLADAEFYRVRVEELREDTRVLMETREMLESQLARARQRADQFYQLEAEIIACKQTINEISLERDAANEKIQELIEENLQLQQMTKLALQESNTVLDSEREDETASGDNSLSEQLTNNAQTRALKLELENRKLLSTIESLREKSFHETSGKLLEIEKEKKKYSIKCDQLQKKVQTLTNQNEELENLFKSALQENKKLQESLDAGKVISDRQNQELQMERQKVDELEKSLDNLNKDKQRINSLYDSVKKRADDAEKMLTQVMEEVKVLQEEVEKGKDRDKGQKEREERIFTLEKEKNNLQKEITKLKQLLEEKDVILDEKNVQFEKQLKELTRLNKEKEITQVQIEKIQEYEKKIQELFSQTTIYTETIGALQKELVSEKINNEKLKSNVERLGLSLDILDNELNVIVEKLLENPKISSILATKSCSMCRNAEDNLYKQTETVVSSISAEWNQQCEKLTQEVSNLQATNELLQAENAQMKVDIATFASQVGSLTSQQAALQLANNQLVAEKEELMNERKAQSQKSDALLLDQTTLRTLHEQLSSEYEQLKLELDQYKKLNRDLRNETRTLRDSTVALEKKITELSAEKDSLKNESKSLVNLRAEHSKLKDDFKNLFTASERLKTEYRTLQEEYKKLRTESGKLRLGQTEMQGELSSRSDLLAGLQFENAKLQQRCDMLFNMNTSLDADRRALMDHVSQLLSQYHSLLTHSLEDKEQFHMEEKQFTDKLNHLCRQKEKLEDKIMEHYRKLDNASAKKKGFGAQLVRRVRKAGSDIMNKVPSRNRRSWHEDNRLTRSQFTLAAGSGGESGGNDSDNSAEDPLLNQSKRNAGKSRDEGSLRRSHKEFTSHRNSLTNDEMYASPSAVSLGSVGSRRTVYLSEDEPSGSPNKKKTVQPQQQTPPPPAAPLLVYNKISTVYGEPQRSNSLPEQQTPVKTNDKETKSKGDGIKENATWYEYGCV